MFYSVEETKLTKFRNFRDLLKRQNWGFIGHRKWISTNLLCTKNLELSEIKQWRALDHIKMEWSKRKTGDVWMRQFLEPDM